ncbi:LanC-like protein 2 [Bulinus truncatus]|nr:LanC-like protein 2 [Bulinus truncatus]
MSAEERAFKNPFPDFTGDGVPVLGKNDELQGDFQSKILSAVEKLFNILGEKTEDDGKDYSVYTGAAGQALLHLHLHMHFPGVQDQADLYKALNWIKPCLARLKGSKPSFLCGNSGPLAIAAVIYDKLGERKLSGDCVAKIEVMCDEVCTDTTLPDEILFGRAGYLSTLMFLQQHLGPKSINRDLVVKVVEAILSSGQELSKRQHCQQPLMYEWHDKAYLGAAHGLAGIYFMLLQVKEPSIQERIQQLVKPCIDYMLTLRYASGNCPSSLESSGGDKLVHWCHGAPGWMYMFVLGYKIYKDSHYLEAAKDCAKVIWKRGILHKGYGLCHGTAGNAYAFLALYKITLEPRYLYYAYKFAEWCCDYGKHGCHTPDRPFSLFEGMAGTIYFLVDFLRPLNAAFPTFEYN